MRVLVTGGVGFVGTHLSKHLVDCRDDVALTYLPRKNSDIPINSELEESRKVIVPRSVQHFALDVRNSSEVNQVLALLQPDIIYHLAAISFVPDGEGNVSEVFNVNTMGTLNLLEGVKKSCPEAKVLIVSSSEVYGIPRPGSLPLTEQSELRPISAYGASKASAEHLAHKFSANDGLHVITIRPFPHVGPFQEDRFALSSFARQIAEIKLGKKKPILEVGNLDVKRDFSDVSDIVRGYREAIFNGRNSEVYNLCSGQSYLLSDIVQTMIKLSGVDVEIKVDEGRVRSVDIPEHVGSYQKANKDFGWRPRVEMDAMLGSLLAYWLEVLSD